MKQSKVIQYFAWILIGLGGIISIWFSISIISAGYKPLGYDLIDFAINGQFGDFIGGVVGTAFTLAGTLLIILTFNAQAQQNKRVTFESAFFEMLRLHRQNVSEINYTSHNGISSEKAENRKVFRIIFRDFLDCFREVKKYSNSKNIDDYILPKYKLHLEKIIKDNGLRKIDLIEMAIIDISYSIVFYGVGEDGEIVLRHNFQRKYHGSYYFGLLRYIKLKPRRENFRRWEIWTALFSMNYKDFKRITDEFHRYRKHLSQISLSPEVQKLVYKTEFVKYYGGHQHRLGHYFRHLFQTYKYLNYYPHLNKDERYFYGKTLRAQLSTYEQALLFINSISSLGMKWELMPDYPDNFEALNDVRSGKMITTYNLIKNLPGSHLFGLKYRVYYPNIKYETQE